MTIEDFHFSQKMNTIVTFVRRDKGNPKRARRPLPLHHALRLALGHRDTMRGPSGSTNISTQGSPHPPGRRTPPPLFLGKLNRFHTFPKVKHFDCFKRFFREYVSTLALRGEKEIP